MGYGVRYQGLIPITPDSLGTHTRNPLPPTQQVPQHTGIPIFNEEDASEAIKTGPADPFLDVLFTSATEGFAVGAYGMIYRTVDGGNKWQLAIAAIDNIDRYHYYALAEDAAGVLYLAGEAGLLFHSEDGGQTFGFFTRHGSTRARRKTAAILSSRTCIAATTRQTGGRR